MAKPGTTTPYEQVRKARIKENKRKLATLGVQKTISELKVLSTPTKYEKTHVRTWQKVDYKSTPLCCSTRLQGNNDSLYENDLPLYHSTPPIKERGLWERKSPEATEWRCSSKGRGSLYHPTYRICCHFYRQNKLCEEEDYKRCGDLDLDEPCIGKTDCSICHSSRGILCRACLVVRYGEEMEEFRANKQWVCPHCIEEKGVKPHWICNNSLCLKKAQNGADWYCNIHSQEDGFQVGGTLAYG